MKEKISDFRQLKVWQKSHCLVLEIYKLTNKFPAEEKYGIVSQMRRAAVSIPANIAEGFKKQSAKEKLNFYNISQSSLEELRYYLILSKDLDYLSDSENLWVITEEISKMLVGLIQSVKKMKKVDK